MKSNIHTLVLACLYLVIPAAQATAAPKSGCEVAVAALTLPNESTGLLHWVAADAVTTPMQLSTRYFSERVKVLGKVIHFYSEAVQSDAKGSPLPEPLVSVKIPPGLGLAYVILWTEDNGDGGNKWKATLFNGRDWKEGSLKVLNASAGPLGIVAGEKRMQLGSGKAMDLHARDHKDSFPVKIYRLQPEAKLVFSSTWRVSARERELCFLSGSGNSVSIRSLIELAAMPKPSDVP